MIGYRSDYDCPDYYNLDQEVILKEEKINTIIEFFEDLCDMIYGRKSLDAEQVDFDIDEICNALKMSRPTGELSIRSI